MSNDFIYCSQCGRKIKSNSKFCRYCGTNLQDDCETDSKIVIDPNAQDKDNHIVSTHGPINSSSFEARKPDFHMKKSKVANAIVANINMIGLAIIAWLIYLISFICIHAKDIVPVTDTNSYYGESCYDKEILTGNWEFSWEKHLALKIAYISTTKNRFGIVEYKPLGTSEYLYLSNLTAENALKEAIRQANEKNISSEEFEQLKQEAHQAAKNDRDSFNQEVSNNRQMFYEDDLHNNMLWSAIIIFVTFVLGRYLIKGIKWVSVNKN